MGGVEGVAPPNIFKFARKFVKSQSRSKRVGHCPFCDLLLVTIVGQLVKTPPPPTEGVSAHHLGVMIPPKGSNAVEELQGPLRDFQ